MVSLGTLEIGLKLNKTAFDRDMKVVQSMMSKKDLGTVIKPQVDHSELEMLNRHIDIKIKHIKQLRAEANKPIVLKTQYQYSSSGKPSLFSDQGKNPSIQLLLKELQSIHSILKDVTKSVKQVSDNTKKQGLTSTVAGSLTSSVRFVTQGAYERIGGNFVESYSQSFISSIEKKLESKIGSFDLLGKTAGDTLSSQVQGLFDSINQQLNQQLEKNKEKKTLSRADASISFIGELRDSISGYIDSIVDEVDKQAEIAIRVSKSQTESKTKRKQQREGNIIGFRDVDQQVSSIQSIVNLESSSDLKRVQLVRANLVKQSADLDVTIQELVQSFDKVDSNSKEGQAILKQYQGLAAKQVSLQEKIKKISSEEKLTIESIKKQREQILKTLPTEQRLNISNIAESEVNAANIGIDLDILQEKILTLNKVRDSVSQLLVQATEQRNIEVFDEAQKELKIIEKQLNQAQKIKSDLITKKEELSNPYQDLLQKRKQLQSQIEQSLSEYPKQYIQIVQKVMGQFDPDNVPQIVGNDKFLENRGSNAGYNSRTNQIILKSDTIERLNEGSLTDREIETLAHELQHAKDYLLGSYDGLIARLTGSVDLSDIPASKIDDIQDRLDQYRQAGKTPETIRNETSAIARGQINARELIRDRNAEQLRGLLGGRGQGFRQRIPIDALRNFNQGDISEDFKTRSQAIINISEKLENKIQSALSGTVDVNPQEINQTIETINSAINRLLDDFDESNKKAESLNIDLWAEDAVSTVSKGVDAVGSALTQKTNEVLTGVANNILALKALPQSSQKYSQATLQVLTQFENTANQIKALYGESLKGQLSPQRIRALPPSELASKQSTAESISRVGQFLLQDYDDVIKQLPKSEKFGELGRRIAHIKSWVENSNKFLERSGMDKASIPDRQLLDVGIKKDSKKRGEFLAIGMAEGVEESYQELRQSVQVLGEMALEEIDDVLDISSPSKQMKKRGSWSVQGFVDGVKSSLSKSQKAFRQWVDSTIDKKYLKDAVTGWTETIHEIDDVIETERQINQPIQIPLNENIDDVRDAVQPRYSTLTQSPILQERMQGYDTNIESALLGMEQDIVNESLKSVQVTGKQVEAILNRVNKRFKELAAYEEQFTDTDNFTKLDNLVKLAEQTGQSPLPEDEINKILSNVEQKTKSLENAIAIADQIMTIEDEGFNREEAIKIFNSDQPDVVDEIAKKANDVFSSLKANIPFIDQIQKGILTIGTLAGAITIANVLKNISIEAIQVYSSFESINSQLKLVKDGASFFENIKQQISDLGGDLKSTTQAGIQFDQALLGGRLQNQSQNLFLQFNEGLQRLQLSSEATERALLAVTQMASKGRVSMEEILQLAESGVPGAMQVMGQALGKTTEGLITQVSSGNVLAEDLLPKFIEQFNANTEILASEVENSITVAMSKVNFQREQLMLNIGAELAPSVFKTLDILNNTILFINQNFEFTRTGLQFLLTGTVALLVPWKLILISIKLIPIQVGKLILSTKMWGIALKTINTVLKSILKSLIVFSLIQLSVELWSKGSTKVRDVNKEIEKTVNKIAEAYKNVKKEKDKALAEDKSRLNDYPKGLFGLGRLNFQYDEGGLRGFLDRLNPLNYQNIIGANTVGSEQYTSFGDLNARDRKKELGEGLNILSQGFGASINLFDQETVNDYISSITELDTQIRRLKGRSRALRLLNPEENREDIANIEREIEDLNTKRQKISNAFLPAGQQGLESLNQRIEEYKDLLNDLQTDGLNVDSEIMEVNRLLELINKALRRNQDINDAITNSYSEQRKTLIDVFSLIAKVNQDTAINQSNRRATLFNLQSSGQLSPQSTQLGLEQLDVISNQENLNNLINFQKERKKILYQISEDTRATIEKITNTSLEQFDGGDLVRLQQYLQDAPQSQKRELDDVVSVLQEYVNTNQEIAQVNEQLSQSQANLNEQIRRTAIERQNLAKSLIDFERTLEDFGREAERQIIDFQRSVYDYEFSIDQFNIDQSRSLRGLQESYSDLYISIEKQTLTAESQINNTIRQINRLELDNRLSDLNPLGVDNPFDGVLDSIKNISDAIDQFESVTDQQQETRLSVEQETLDIARQIRSLEEQQEDMERQRNQSVRQFQIQAEQLQRQQEDFNRNQKRQWEDILYQASQIAQQAYEMGIVLNDVGLGIAEQGQGLIDAIANVAQGINSSSYSMPSYSDVSSNISGVLGYIGSTGIGTGSHLDIRGWQSDKRDNRITETRLKEILKLFEVGGKTLAQQTNLITSGYGRRKPPVAGASSNHPALDFGFKEGTPIKFLGNATNIKQRPNLGNAGNTLEITLPTGEIIQLLHLKEFGDAVKTTTQEINNASITRTDKSQIYGNSFFANNAEKLFTAKVMLGEAEGEDMIGKALAVNSFFNRIAMVRSGQVPASHYNAKSGSATDILTAPAQYQSYEHEKHLRNWSQSQIEEMMQAISIAENRQFLLDMLKSKEPSLRKRQALINATGFRTGDAFEDNSQNYNRAKYHGHIFNSDKTAQNVNMNAVRMAFQKPITRTDKTDITPSHQNNNRLSSSGFLTQSIELPSVRQISIPNNPPQFNGLLNNINIPNPSDLIKPLSNYNLPNFSDIEQLRQEQVEEQNRINRELAIEQLNSIINQAGRQLQKDKFNISGENINLTREINALITKWREIQVNAKGYLTLQEKIKKAGRDAVQPYKDMQRQLEDVVRLNQRILEVGINSQSLDDFNKQIERIRNNTNLTTEQQEKYVTQIEEMINAYGSGEFKEYLELKEKELNLSKDILQAIQLEAESVKELAKERTKILELFNQNQGLFNFQNQAVQSEQKLRGGGGLFDKPTYDQIMFDNSKQAIQSRLITESERLGFEPDTAKYNELADNLERIARANIANAFYEASPAIQQFEQSITGVLMGTQSLNDTFKSFFNMIASEIIKMTITKPLTNMVGNLFGGFFGGFNNGGFIGNMANGGSIQDAMKKEKVLSGNQPVLAVLNNKEYIVSARDGQMFEEYKTMRKMNNLSLEYQEVKNYNQGGFVNSNHSRDKQPQANGVTYVVNSNNNISVQSPTLVGESLTQVENRQNEQLQRANRRFG